MRKPILVAVLAGTAGVLTLGGTTAALAVHDDNRERGTTSTTADRGIPQGNPPAAAPQRVGADRAEQIAKQQVPGAAVTEIELDREHGRAVWEIDLTGQHREYEVDVDATTGAVLGTGHDNHTDDD